MVEKRTTERIATAALKILLDEGAQAVTMRRVATDAGVTAMATYRHYSNREALLRAVADEAIAQVTKDWQARRDAGTFEARLDGLTDAFLDFALGMPKLYTFVVAELRDDALRFPGDFRDGGSPVFAPVLEAVAQSIEEGELRADDDPLEVTLAIVTPAMGLVQLYHGGRMEMPEADFRALCKRTIRRVIHGLRP
ncbi:TetR/AcrR family transcriptional regulator [Spongiactinospora sp. TRM90649]|uniref:TetR/AcrR family transcriptional regulator n=1 Tax=Spongiactinospora sp. TRM90649 TaxID=3031114 RepID=UPI0023F9A567|nr:TetR/AcrR family transcriptional regulator [Spongiactinospora sp. TRM90649]MDF5754701.1 TetR/AcrR family transcriptional regulator [Spongiactinospora sp. TRM90649]